MLIQVVTNQAWKQRGNRQNVVDTSKIREFFRMNPPDFTGSSVTEDLANFVEQLQKVFEVMHIADVECVELAAYQLKGVARVWYDQWKKSSAPIEKSNANLSSFQHKPNRPAPSSASAPAPKSRGEFKDQNSQNFRARPAQSQGSMERGGNWTPTCAKCCRNHPGACRDGFIGCFKFGQAGHFMRECPKNRQGNGNRGNRAQSSSVDPQDRATPRGDTSGTSGGANLHIVSGNGIRVDTQKIEAV
ncbi:uncharacterized protein LOC125837432 [Solanum verrucosum]|uniref:uncharacterized protein LOC125837432 n=1 Tax=Solanum verrucosum TaxID=315347 RepID=UPI0020D07E7D|nr:uncharacterized protein LOC125837432 [Solanum verrucosum]